MGSATGAAELENEMRVVCKDGKEWGAEVKLVGSAKKVRDREITKPPKIGEYPVFVEQQGDYRMFTYSSKISEIA